MMPGQKSMSLNYKELFDAAGTQAATQAASALRPLATQDMGRGRRQDCRLTMDDWRLLKGAPTFRGALEKREGEADREYS
jgi:hypothetical protein